VEINSRPDSQGRGYYHGSQDHPEGAHYGRADPARLAKPPVRHGEKLPVDSPDSLVDDHEEDSAQKEHGEYGRHPDGQKYQSFSAPGAVVIDDVQGILDAEQAADQNEKGQKEGIVEGGSQAQRPADGEAGMDGSGIDEI